MVQLLLKENRLQAGGRLFLTKGKSKRAGMGKTSVGKISVGETSVRKTSVGEILAERSLQQVRAV